MESCKEVSAFNLPFFLVFRVPLFHLSRLSRPASRVRQVPLFGQADLFRGAIVEFQAVILSRMGDPKLVGFKWFYDYIKRVFRGVWHSPGGPGGPSTKPMGEALPSSVVVRPRSPLSPRGPGGPAGPGSP